MIDTPYSLPVSKDLTGEGTLKFTNAEFFRAGGSSGSVSVDEKYTLNYDYANQGDVSVEFNGVPQVITFITDSTVEAPGSLVTDLVRINVVNGTLKLNQSHEGVTSFNTLMNGGENIAPTAPQDGTDPEGSSNVSLGSRALSEITTAINTTAVGARSLLSVQDGINNTGIGFQALYRTDGFDNTAVGSIAGEWIETGHSNTLCGKASGGKIVGGRWNVAAGVDAMAEAEESTYVVAIGYRANGNTGSDSQSNSTYVGSFAGDFCKASNSTGIGYRALNCENAGTATPNNCVAVGAFSGRHLDTGRDNTLIGVGAADDFTVMNFSTVIGMESADNPTGSVNHLTTVGWHTARDITGDGNTAIGSGALITETTGTNNTALGFNSGRLSQAGGSTNFNNATTLGNDARVSGDNQVQLGNSATTTYAYGAVQDRSDARDKIVKGGITDSLIAFFMDIEWKRYLLDYRDDYLEVDALGNVTKLEKDGSKARSREHCGAIAQQVEEAMKKHNVDFAGLQHHKVKGGEDVYTIGYQEFIAIQGEILQRQQKAITGIVSRLDKAGL